MARTERTHPQWESRQEGTDKEEQGEAAQRYLHGPQGVVQCPPTVTSSLCLIIQAASLRQCRHHFEKFWLTTKCNDGPGSEKRDVRK